MSRRRIAGIAALGILGLLLLIQLVPYGHDHSNPPVTRAAQWPDRQGEQLAEAACYDCHSNLTDWRWYSNVAPVSWLIQNDVNGGREALNFSEWDHGQPDVSEVVNEVTSGEMPPLQYRLVHPAAKLSASEKDRLASAISALYAKDPPPAGG